MKDLFPALAQTLSETFLPHYKEDMFRGALVGTALRRGWKIAEPRPANSTLIQAGEAAVYLLSWEHGKVSSTPSTVDNVSGTKPDIRLISPGGVHYTCELKCGLTGSAAESNSNSTKVAEDIDLVAAGQRNFFCGLFDAGMFDRIQGRLSTAGRGGEVRTQLGDLTFLALQQAQQPGDIVSIWRATSLRSSIVPVVCKGGVPLALILVRQASATY